MQGTDLTSEPKTASTTTPVKAGGFRDPERLPPASSPPRALRLTGRCRLTKLSTSIRHRSVPRAVTRPPSPIPAATRLASLSPTPLADFCNQTKTRAHRTNDSISPEACFHMPRLPAMVTHPGKRAARAQPESLGWRRRRHRSRWPGIHESACTQRYRGPLERTRAPRCRHFPPAGPGKPAGQGKQPRPSARPVARTTGALERTEVLSAAKEPHWKASSVGPSRPRSNSRVGKHTPLRCCFRPTLTGGDLGEQRQNEPREQGSNQPERNAPRRP